MLLYSLLFLLSQQVRRVIVSAIKGTAIIKLKVQGRLHEFSGTRCCHLIKTCSAAYIMEPNNTDFPARSNGKPRKALVTDASTKISGDNEVNIGDSALTTSGNYTMVQAMLGSKLSMVQGFRGLTRQLHLFYQTSSSDITWTKRDEYDIGDWKDPTTLNVGIYYHGWFLPLWS